ncbi:MAG: tRNA (guanosine(46)-N(7))-methyltransferase TrmB [Congregibacter sp.]
MPDTRGPVPASPSREVSSSQKGVHPRLPELVARHQHSAWQKPVQAVDMPAIRQLDEALDQHTGPLLLDSFCGTGLSTRLLAAAYTDALVIGVDQSAQRLSKGGDKPDNCLLLQAHCEAIWRHLVQRRQQVVAHYLLYPNPWPKPAHLGRRLHGHPAFSLLPKLGGIMELRSNWQVYVEECGVALHLLGMTARICALPEQEHAQEQKHGNTLEYARDSSQGSTPAFSGPTTLFERKYRSSGHRLWRLSARMRE